MHLLCCFPYDRKIVLWAKASIKSWKPDDTQKGKLVSRKVIKGKFVVRRKGDDSFPEIPKKSCAVWLTVGLQPVGNMYKPPPPRGSPKPLDTSFLVLLPLFHGLIFTGFARSMRPEQRGTEILCVASGMYICSNQTALCLLWVEATSE